ncbi:MAG: hypothetical protein K8T25_04645 [Planctomycetia bacterium]|nr:hypothetical protein [Planctomycetia bacterium]
MIRIILDAHQALQLADLRGPLELCDATGRVLARAVPVADISQCDAVTPGVGDEELDRRSTSNEKRYTTDEMLDRLRG